MSFLDNVCEHGGQVVELWIWKVFEENLKQVAAVAVGVDGRGGGGEG